MPPVRAESCRHVRTPAAGSIARLSESSFGVLDPQTHHLLINKVSFTVCFPDVAAASARLLALVVYNPFSM